MSSRFKALSHVTSTPIGLVSMSHEIRSFEMMSVEAGSLQTIVRWTRVDKVVSSGIDDLEDQSW